MDPTRESVCTVQLPVAIAAALNPTFVFVSSACLPFLSDFPEPSSLGCLRINCFLHTRARTSRTPFLIRKTKRPPSSASLFFFFSSRLSARSVLVPSLELWCSYLLHTCQQQQQQQLRIPCAAWASFPVVADSPLRSQPHLVVFFHFES